MRCEFITEAIRGREVLGGARFLALREHGFDFGFGDGGGFRADTKVGAIELTKAKPQNPVHLTCRRRHAFRRDFLQRKHLVETNKAAEAAEIVRRRWIMELLGRDTMPKNAEPAALILLRCAIPDNLDWRLAETLSPTWSDSLVRATHRLVALALAAHEKHMPKDYWRRPQSARHATYLAHLSEWGYALAPHEQDVVDGAAAAKAAD